MSEPLETGVTIKYGKGYEETWATFRGGIDQIRSQIVAYFGLEDVEGLTLHEVAVKATAIAHGKVKATAAGAVSLGTSPTQDEAIATVKEVIGAEVVEDSKPDHSALIAQLGAAASVDELKRLWVSNKAAFEDADVKAAYKARGAALKAAA